MSTLSPTITSGDRLSFTTFLAIMIHAAIILGVTFTYVAKKPSTHTMEVTLVQHADKNKPKTPDFLAQFNQVGSGTLDEKALITSPTQAEFQDTVIRETSVQQQPKAARKVEQQQKPVVTTSGKSEQKALADVKVESPDEGEFKNPDKKSLLQRSLEIASLEARLEQQRQVYANRPRIKRLTSLSTASSVDAFYLNSWRRKIESIGNLNYPREARKRKLYGSLRLMVAIEPDGALQDVRLLETSGHKVLDDAAINIVRLAAPFAPFSDELRQTTDVLEIIRTWQFRKNSSLRSF
jgi:protein TonB